MQYFSLRLNLRSSLFCFLLAAQSESQGEATRTHEAATNFFVTSVPVPSRNSRLSERKRKRPLHRLPPPLALDFSLACSRLSVTGDDGKNGCGMSGIPLVPRPLFRSSLLTAESLEQAEFSWDLFSKCPSFLYRKLPLLGGPAYKLSQLSTGKLINTSRYKLSSGFWICLINSIKCGSFL